VAAFEITKTIFKFALKGNIFFHMFSTPQENFYQTISSGFFLDEILSVD
jgi:hypothetical protein